MRRKIEKQTKTMATAIKAIPTLYGEAARRFRDMADEAEREFDMQPKRDITKDPSYMLCAGFWKGRISVCELWHFLMKIVL